MKALAAAAIVFGLGAAAPAPVEVTMPGRFYSPGDVSILLGTTVTFRNIDGITHTVTADNDAFDSGFLRPGETFTQTFTAAGALRFHCRIHRFMRGVLRVYALVLTGPDHTLLAGRAATLRGIAPAGTTEVLLEQLTRARWVEVARRAPAEDGSYTFTRPAREPARYRARTGESVSPIVRVHVAPKVEARVEGGRLAVATSPARPRARVHLQVYERERFAFFSVVRATLDARGRASLSLNGLSGAHVRALVVESDGWSSAASRAVVARG